MKFWYKLFIHIREALFYPNVYSHIQEDGTVKRYTYEEWQEKNKFKLLAKAQMGYRLPGSAEDSNAVMGTITIYFLYNELTGERRIRKLLSNYMTEGDYDSLKFNWYEWINGYTDELPVKIITRNGGVAPVLDPDDDFIDSKSVLRKRETLPLEPEDVIPPKIIQEKDNVVSVDFKGKSS